MRQFFAGLFAFVAPGKERKGTFPAFRQQLSPPRPLLLLLLGMAALLSACAGALEAPQQRMEREAAQQRLARAQALFAERCKTAGVVIHRTVKDVEGIELTQLRPPVPWGGREYFDPMWAEAAMAAEHRGNDYINQFLMTESIDALDPSRRGSLNSPDFDAGPRSRQRRGYQFVEIIDPKTRRLQRAQFDEHSPGTNLWGKEPRLTPIADSNTRYALDYEDIVNEADRQLWVAGTVLKVIDKQTGEVIALLTRYVWDPGFGVRATGRWPWQHAAGHGSDRECPSLPGAKNDISRKFIDAILIPKQKG